MSSGWGRGGMVGVHKALWQHGQALARAAVILQEEHGKRHDPGTRCDLCPTCQREKAESRTANARLDRPEGAKETP